MSQPNVVDIPPGTNQFFENPEEGDAVPPDGAEVETAGDTSEASRRFHLLPTLSTAAVVSVALVLLA